MDKVVINGGKELTGEVHVSGAKNAALPILVSSLLTDGMCEYRNVPNLRDIQSIIELLRHLGANVEMENDIVRIDASGLCNVEAPYDIVRKMRASILVLCPLVARLNTAKVSLPGGCAIGQRPINFHLKALDALGAKIDLDSGYVNAKADCLIGADIYFDMPTVTGTENIMMAAVLAQGETILRNAAREPEITALADVLIQMGADINGAGTSKITIRGVRKLNPVSVSIIPDRIEAGTFMVAAALTKGNICIKNCEPDHMAGIINKLRMTGTDIFIDGRCITVIGKESLESVDIKTQPFPGFPTDMQAQFMVLMSIAEGTSMITETIFENRFIHVSELRRMGAEIKISGNVAMVRGRKYLSGAEVMASDLRASASLILAGLAARGTTVVNRVYHLDRGYELLEKKFHKLGADIERIKTS